MNDPIRYLIDPLAPFPQRWRDHIGPIRVLAGPVDGWLMVRRRNAAPFCLRVAHLLNSEPHPHHGPFTVEGKTRGISAINLSGGGNSHA